MMEKYLFCELLASKTKFSFRTKYDMIKFFTDVSMLKVVTIILNMIFARIIVIS